MQARIFAQQHDADCVFIDIECDARKHRREIRPTLQSPRRAGLRLSRYRWQCWRSHRLPAVSASKKTSPAPCHAREHLSKMSFKLSAGMFDFGPVRGFDALLERGEVIGDVPCRPSVRYSRVRCRRPVPVPSEMQYMSVEKLSFSAFCIASCCSGWQFEGAAHHRRASRGLNGSARAAFA